MDNKLFLGIDIGTTSLKAAVFDSEGNRRALRSADYVLDTDSDTGYIEFDPEKYIDICREVIDSLIEECGSIEALSVDTQGETIILCDENDNPLYPAVVWLDNRATVQADEIKDYFGNRLVYEITGQPEITAGWPASKLLWFRQKRADVFEKTKKVFLLEDWVLFRLTGNFVTEPTIQSSTIYYDINKKQWWSEMLDYVGINAEMLPNIVKSGTVIGEYKGIKVVSGALDQISGTIGVGVTDGNSISEMTGTIMAVCVMTDKMPPYNPDSIIPCHLHSIDGTYCLILWSSTAGMALKWFRNNFAENLSFAELDKLAEKIPAGCEGMTMLPYFCGSTMPKYNPDASASFNGITLAHNRAHFARAIMEAVAFTLKQNLEYIETEAPEIRITGGGASSTLWAQIKADVTGKELKTVCESETACLGTAILAAVGAGEFASIQDAAHKIIRIKKTYSPDGTDYSAAYESYCRLDKLLNK